MCTALNRSLITGATGFVGSAILQRLLQGEHTGLLAAVRRDGVVLPGAVMPRRISSDMRMEDSDAFEGVQLVIHCAARAHIMKDESADPLTEFRKVNVQGTLNLAKQAAAGGVKRFIFLSSVKVNGEITKAGQPFTPDDKFIPSDPYGLSKYEAEQGLMMLAKQTGMEVVIIRPPLIYGPGVKANFAAMMHWLNKGLPLPLGAVITNQRSLVALDNLVDFIVTCIDHPKAANQIFLISDGEDVSTAELLRKTAKAIGKKALLIPVPVSLMRFAAKLIGKTDVGNRLFGSLQVDSSKARELLGWKPVISMEEQLQKTADAYLNEKTV
jgi:nucleoside-diphosphate-sugar epimerase